MEQSGNRAWNMGQWTTGGISAGYLLGIFILFYLFFREKIREIETGTDLAQIFFEKLNGGSGWCPLFLPFFLFPWFLSLFAIAGRFEIEDFDEGEDWR